MKRTYTTTIITTWDIRGDVSVDQINDRISIAVRQLMMTQEGPSRGYAFRDPVEEDSIVTVDNGETELSSDELLRKLCRIMNYLEDVYRIDPKAKYEAINAAYLIISDVFNKEVK